MKTLKKVGTIAAGAVMLGAAFSSAVSAGLDATGLTPGFFYDAGYNPIAQIVVGQGGLASDSVAAGNIAAVIGNLAYSAKQTTIALDPTAQGKVVLSVSAKGASGKYEQADHGGFLGGTVSMISYDSSNGNYSQSVPSSFYDDDEGLPWGGDEEIYEKGEFVTYSLSCETQRTDAGILKEATYNNIHCLFCETLCLEQLENPEHTMEESIMVAWDDMYWYEAGLNAKDAESLMLWIPKNSVQYRVDTQCIPMEKLDDAGSPANTIDFEWRGKLLLFGDEYYVKNIKGTTSNAKIYLSKGKVLDDVTSEGYTSEYLGYKFKIDHLIYSAEFQVAGILLDVEKPDGTVVQTQISKLANGIVDDIEIAGVYAEESDAVATASVIVYDSATNIMLEDNKEIQLSSDSTKGKKWYVDLNTMDAADSDDITDYSQVGSGQTCLENITVTYKANKELAEGDSLEFPATFVLTFLGYRTNDFLESPCSGAGEGNIMLTKDEDYKLFLSFTGDDGQRYDDVGLYQGPYTPGEKFMLGGKVYEYDSDDGIVENTDECNTAEIYFKNLLQGGKDKIILDAYTGSQIVLTTYSFEEGAENDYEIEIDPDADDCNATDVFSLDLDGEGFGTDGVSLLYNDGEIYFVYEEGSTIPDQYIGVWGLDPTGAEGQVGAEFESFDEDGNRLALYAYYELEEDFNGDDAEENLVIVRNEQNEVAVIDLYDWEYNSSTSATAYYDMSIIGTDTDVWSDVSGISDMDLIGAKLDDEDDILLILPDGGDRITADYGSNRRIDSVSICHPKDEVYGTSFIGTGEQETVLEAVITKDDEGKEQTVGCCTYTVKEFSVTATAASQTVTETTVNAVSGGLVVPEVGADLSKNLIIVGGPAVNSMCTVTAAEIGAASDRYIVKKDGSKVIVAGYDAADSVAAGNALIRWLQENVHA